jgi:16S rRNA G966 N2-methylase RsmD
MKYMGSKRVMLLNGLGDLIRAEARRKKRIVDLFSGAGSVSWFVAQSFRKSVVSVDLQEFARVLAQCVVERTSPVDGIRLDADWIGVVQKRLHKSKCWRLAQALDHAPPNTATWAKRARVLCSRVRGTGPMWRAYAGYYLSPSQAAVFDVLRRALPLRGPARWVGLASLIIAASKCVAAPGHTAQPFGTSRTSSRFLREAWLRDPLVYVRRAVTDLSNKYARVRGKAKVGDAVRIAGNLRESDLVFVDPPYSGVHYSRFYHVLETLARGTCGRVSGTGRYPPPCERPTSLFSQKLGAPRALDQLFRSLSESGCTVIVTFPAHECSNGLSGKSVAQCADQHFAISRKVVKTRFSTLGGNGHNRSARQDSQEMLLVLRPK